MKRRIIGLFLLATASGCVFSSGIDDPEVTSFIVLGGETLDFDHLVAWTLPDRSEYVAGKRLILTATREESPQGRVIVTVEFGDLTPGIHALDPFGVPMVTLEIDSVPYLATGGTLEVFEGSLEEGSHLRLELRDLGIDDGCGAGTTFSLIQLEATVEGNLEPDLVSSAIAEAGYIRTTITSSNLAPFPYLGLAESFPGSLGSNAAWRVESIALCTSREARGFILLFDLVDPPSAGLQSLTSRTGVNFRLLELDATGRTTKVWVVVDGELDLSTSPAWADGAELRGTLTGATLYEYDGSNLRPDLPSLAIDEMEFRLIVRE